MTYAFISYKREDEARVAKIARALEKSGIDVWWDRGLPSGENWHANIEAKLDGANCVIVIWSKGSVAPDGFYVRDEARRGLARDILVPVRIEKFEHPPLGFGEVQAIDLSGWKGAVGNPFFQDLVAAVRAKLRGEAVPKANGPMARVARRLMVGAASSAAMATAGAIVFNTFGTASMLCSAPGLQPGLSDACGAAHLGDRPTRTERLAWLARRPGNCPALRSHIARFPEGAYRREAADLLTARQVEYRETWTPVTRALSLFVTADGPTSPTEAAARARALARAGVEAERLCRAFGAGTLFRLVAATSRAESWTCVAVGGGAICGFEGEAECDLEERGQVEFETCGPKT